MVSSVDHCMSLRESDTHVIACLVQQHPLYVTLLFHVTYPGCALGVEQLQNVQFGIQSFVQCGSQVSYLPCDILVCMIYSSMLIGSKDARHSLQLITNFVLNGFFFFQVEQGVRGPASEVGAVLRPPRKP